MKQEINPQDTNRAEAFSMWMKSPMPMVTLMKTLVVSRLVKVSKKTGIRFTTLMCWCIGKAASQVEEFYMLPENGKMYRFDRLAINIVVENTKGGICLCDVPYYDDIHQFNDAYIALTRQAAESCKSSALDGYMVVGTSALPQIELDCIVNQYSGIYNNPFVAWGRYRKGLFKTTLPVSLQFHHAQMDGSHAAKFLLRLQEEINHLYL